MATVKAQSNQSEGKPDATKSAPKEVKKCGALANAGDQPVDISRIDMRVGKIVEVERHPDADSLYIEKVL